MVDIGRGSSLMYLLCMCVGATASTPGRHTPIACLRVRLLARRVRLVFFFSCLRGDCSLCPTRMYRYIHSSTTIPFSIPRLHLSFALPATA